MRTTGSLDVLTPSLNIFSYIAACNVCIPSEQWNLVKRSTDHGQPFLSLALPLPTLPPLPCIPPLCSCTILPLREWQCVSHNVALKPILEEVMEDEGSMWMRYWSPWALIIPTL